MQTYTYCLLFWEDALLLGTWDICRLRHLNVTLHVPSIYCLKGVQAKHLAIRMTV